MKDMQGIEICVGDAVILAHRRGSSQWLDKRTVQSITSDGVPILETPPRTHTKAGKRSKEYTMLYPYRGGSGAICVLVKKDSTILSAITQQVNGIFTGNHD